MRLGQLANRAVVIKNDRALDVERASNGRFSADPQALYADWQALRDWEATASYDEATVFSEADLGCPAPRPRQVFAIGLNYRDHAAEAGTPIPTDIVVFTKFASSFGPPNADVVVATDKLDYETELVVVIGKEARKIAPGTGWDYVAGVAVGQDYSDRGLQFVSHPPQFSLAKSLPGFSPFGPTVVSVDELKGPDALAIGAEITRDGEKSTLQKGSTADLIFSVPAVIERLAEVLTVYPGDVIFTGTPAGVGLSKKFFLKPGDVVESRIEGVGAIRNRFVAA